MPPLCPNVGQIPEEWLACLYTTLSAVGLINFKLKKKLCSFIFLIIIYGMIIIMNSDRLTSEIILAESGCLFQNAAC